MREHVEALTDSFTDYAGKVHHFVIAAVSKDLIKDESPFTIIAKLEDPVNAQAIIEKELCIGISICNPEDKFDEQKGALKAISRARNSEAVIYVTHSGYINTKMVKALLEQEAEYLKQNPEKYIKGYDDAKKRYFEKQEMTKVGNNLSEIERIIVDKLIENPKYLENVDKYLAWLSKQSKCKK